MNFTRVTNVYNTEMDKEPKHVESSQELSCHRMTYEGTQKKKPHNEMRKENQSGHFNEPDSRLCEDVTDKRKGGGHL